jgi:transposase
MHTSASSLLRMIRRTPVPTPATPRVLGVDDFALRRSHRYGTILVDLERHQPIALLADRSADTLADWLRTHPGVEIIVRDRSTEYTRGATEGAPTAIQIADRWHVLQNLREAVERVLQRHHTALGQLPLRISPNAGALLCNPKPRRLRSVTASEQMRSDNSRIQRLARYQAVQALQAEGVSQREIARRLGMSRVTVRRFTSANTFPERALRQPRDSILDPYLAYLQRRWAAGCSNGSQLWRDIRTQGYAGAQRHVLRWVQRQRTSPAQTGPKAQVRANAIEPSEQTPLAVPLHTSHVRLAAARQLVGLFIRDAHTLGADDRRVLMRLLQDPQMADMYTLIQEFQSMVRTRHGPDLSDWLTACTASGLPDLQSFAAGLQRDEAAIRNALTESWSTGPVEGHINRLKMIKRQMYGRASLDLLQQRVLYAA